MTLCAPLVTILSSSTSDPSNQSSCLLDDDMRRILKHSDYSNKQLVNMNSISLKNALEKTYSGQCSKTTSYDLISSSSLEDAKLHRCWVRQVFSIDPLLAHELDQRFRPSWPSTWYTNKYQWLSNHDIEDVMLQYTLAYPDFIFLGALPCNFAEINIAGQCVATQLCRFNPSEGHDYGMIINHDRHDQSGTHWVALYFSTRLENPLFGMYYFDSVGQPPKPQVKEFMNSVARTVERDIAPFPIHQNSKRHQFKNTECGMFSLAFIVRCITDPYKFGQDATCEAIAKSIGTDDDVNALRSEYFMPTK